MDAMMADRLLYSWAPVLVILGAWLLAMFLMRRRQVGPFSRRSAIQDPEMTKALTNINHELREIRTELGRLAARQGP